MEEEEFEKYSEKALLLFKPYRSTSDLLGTRRKYSEAFTDLKETEYFQNSQARRILSKTEQHNSGKRRAKELRDARREAEIT